MNSQEVLKRTLANDPIAVAECREKDFKLKMIRNQGCAVGRFMRKLALMSCHNF